MEKQHKHIPMMQRRTTTSWTQYCIALSLLTWSLVSHGANYTPLEQPLVGIYIDMGACPYDIRVNDGPVYTDRHGLGFNGRYLAVNKWLVPGDNELAVYFFPRNQENDTETDHIAGPDSCYGTIQLLLAPKVDTSESFQEVQLLQLAYRSPSAYTLITEDEAASGSEPGHYRYTDQKDTLIAEDTGCISVGPVTIEPLPEGGVVLLRTFSLPLPELFANWAYLDSDIIEDSEHTKRELFEHTKMIRQLIKDNNMPQLNRLIAERTRELAQAIYTDEDRTNAANLLGTTINDSSATLMPFIDEQKTFEYTTLQILANGRMARLLTWDDGSLIGFNFDEGGSREFPFIFRKSGDEWIITR